MKLDKVIGILVVLLISYTAFPIITNYSGFKIDWSFAATVVTNYTWTERYVDNTLSTDLKAEGTATGGGNDYILLEAGSDGSDDTYNNYGVMITGGTGYTAGARQSRRIIDYDATGNGNGELYAQVESNWGTNPDATSTYEITVGSDSNNGVAAGLYGGTNGAWRQIQHAVDTATAGMRSNVLSGREYDIADDINLDTNDGTSDDPIGLWGYTSTIGDGGKAIIDGTSTALYVLRHSNGADRMFIRDFEWKNATTYVYWADGSGTDDTILWQNLVSASGGDGINIAAGAGQFIYYNEITGCTNQGIDGAGSGALYMWNYIHDITDIGVENPWIFMHNIVDTTTGESNLSCVDENIIMYNLLYNASGAGDHNIDLGSTAERSQIINNIMHTANDHNAHMAAGSNVWIYGYNVTFNAGNGTEEDWLVVMNIDGFQTGDPDLVDPANATPANNDFNLGSSTTIDDDGFPDSFPGISNTDGHMEMGATPYEETGGGVGGGGRRAGWSIQ